MWSEPVGTVMQGAHFLTLPPKSSVLTAVLQMEAAKVSAVMVVDGDKLVGIFTERDAAFRVMAGRRDPGHTPLAEVMTTAVFTVTPHESFGWAMKLMYDHGFRHMPVVVDGVPVGIVSSRHALDPDLEDFESEAVRRRNIRRFAAGV